MLYTFQELKEKDNTIFEKTGKKAKSLIELYRLGFPVPDGCCILAEALRQFLKTNSIEPENLYDLIRAENSLKESINVLQHEINNGMIPEQLQQGIKKFLAENPDTHFAVRSSGTHEDLQEASFAGMYTTILNVKGEDEIFKALKECWASLFNERVIRYCADKKIPFNEMELAVVIQKMVPAEKSGVVFTVNPVKGFDKEIVIEACFGLGEALVGGEVTPDQYIYNWYEDKEVSVLVQEKEIAIYPLDKPPFTEKAVLPENKRKEQVLSPAEISQLAAICAKIQASYGFPVDIEWAAYRNKFYILQSRPITQISYRGIEGEWTTADFKDGGVSSTVCSQFMWSLYDFIWENTMPKYLEKTKLIDKDYGIVWGDMFFGRPYWNVGAVKDGLKRLPGFTERSFDEDLGIQVAYQGEGYKTKTSFKTLATGLQVISALNKSFREQMEYCPKFADIQRKRLAELEKVEAEKLSRDDFFAFYESFIRKDYFLSESSYFYLIFDNSNVTTLFKESFEKVKGDFNYLNLISGLTDLSHLRFNYSLWDISRKIRSDNDSLNYWQQTGSDELVKDWAEGKTGFLMEEVRHCIDLFRYHSTRELDITVPRFGEDPSFVMESIKSSLDIDDNMNPRELNQRQYEAYLREKEKFLGAVPFLSKHRIEKKLGQLRNFLWWREELRDLSTQMYFYVRKFTIIAARHLCEMGILEEENEIFYLPVDDLIAVIKGEINVAQAKKLLERNILYYQSFRAYQNPNEIGSRYLSQSFNIEFDADAQVLTGVPCSPGTVTGKVKVIKDIFDADRLEKDDILITKFTDPGWTPKFSLLKGVATETGGLLSHAAVISREYGIPAVLAIPNITRILKDGQEITIDGNAGKIVVNAKPDTAFTDTIK